MKRPTNPTTTPGEWTDLPINRRDWVSTSPEASWSMRLRLWRSRQIASPRFRRLMASLPFTRWIANRKANQLFQLTTGFVHSQILWSCVRLGVFDALVDRWLSTEALAQMCALPVQRMRLLLQQAERLGLVRAAAGDCWMLDDAGAVIASDKGLTEMILHHQMFYDDLRRPDELLRSERPPTALGTYWAYARNHATDEIEDAAVAPYSALMRESQSMMADCILASHDFAQYRSVLDVGGGDGAFLAELAKRHPQPALGLFDLPPVAERARLYLQQCGLEDRSQVHGGSFVDDALPENRCRDGDCVTLIRILCDHDDDRVLRILRNLYRSMLPGCRLLIAEAMAGTSEGARLAAIYFSFYFLAMGSGRCRSDLEIMGLLAQAGFRNLKTVETPNPLLAKVILAER